MQLSAQAEKSDNAKNLNCEWLKVGSAESLVTVCKDNMQIGLFLRHGSIPAAAFAEI